MSTQKKTSSFDRDGIRKIKTSSSMDDILDELTKPRSASLNNIEHFHNKSARTSPKVERYNSHGSHHHHGFHLSASPLKGLKKKLNAFKLSKSNSDLSSQASQQETIEKSPNYDPNKLLPYATPNTLNTNVDSGNRSPRDVRKNWQRDEMRKKKNSENNNSFVNTQQQPPNHHHSESNGSVTNSHAHSQSFDRHSSNSDTLSLSSVKDRHRSSQDSTDQYIVVEALHDDSQDSPSETDECDGFQPTYSEEYTHQEIDRLLKKIDKTKDELVQMQATKDEYVKEYLKSADVDDSSETAIKNKMNFEKNNQKTNASIQLLQKKLEKYQEKLKVLEERGIHGPKRIIRAVQDSVRSGASSITGAVSKPLGSLNNFMKKDKRNTSSDNVSLHTSQTEDGMERMTSMNNISDEDSSSCSNNILGSSHHSDIDCGGMNENHPLHGIHFTERINSQNEQIEDIVKENEEMREGFTKMKDDMERMLQRFQEERYKNEQLSNEVSDMYHQWHDLTELHQNEMSGLKQEMDQTLERIECMEYRFSERSGDIEEAIGGCETRITKMELQQQHQQQLLLSVDGYFDAGGNTKALLTKLLSLVLNMFTILLLLLSTLSKILMPFTSTRTRIITTSITILCLIIFCRNTENGLMTLYDIARQIFLPLYNRIPFRTASSEMSNSESSEMETEYR